MDQRRLLCQRVVGRERETLRFDELLKGLPLGAGATLVISGAAGVGKSALLRELERRAGAKGIPFLVGRCAASGGRPPFGPLADVLDTIVRLGIGGVTPDRLARTYPDLARLRQDAVQSYPPRERDDAERYRVHSGVARLLRTVADQTPVVVAIDDIHWADEGTLELLPFLASKLHNYPVLIVALHRQDDADEAGLAHALAALSRERIAESMPLAPLTRTDVAAMVDATLAMRDGAAASLLSLLESCEGNPFFIEEVLIGLAASSDLVYYQGRWELTRAVRGRAVPESVRSAVDQRMRSLPSSAQRVVMCAAVIGQRADFEILRHVSASTESDLIESLRSAIAAHLLTEVTDDRGSTAYAFRHALTRESVLAGMLEREKELLHLRVGTVLESLGWAGRDRSEELAYQSMPRATVSEPFDITISPLSRQWSSRRSRVHECISNVVSRSFPTMTRRGSTSYCVWGAPRSMLTTVPAQPGPARRRSDSRPRRGRPSKSHERCWIRTRRSSSSATTRPRRRRSPGLSKSSSRSARAPSLRPRTRPAHFAR